MDHKSRLLYVSTDGCSTIEDWLRKFVATNQDQAFFSLGYVAKRAKMPRSIISEILNGKRKLNLRHLSKIAEGLSLPAPVQADLLRLFLTQNEEYKGLAGALSTDPIPWTDKSIDVTSN